MLELIEALPDFQHGEGNMAKGAHKGMVTSTPKSKRQSAHISTTKKIASEVQPENIIPERLQSCSNKSSEGVNRSSEDQTDCDDLNFARLSYTSNQSMETVRQKLAVYKYQVAEQTSDIDSLISVNAEWASGDSVFPDKQTPDQYKTADTIDIPTVDSNKADKMQGQQKHSQEPAPVDLKELWE